MQYHKRGFPCYLLDVQADLIQNEGHSFSLCAHHCWLTQQTYPGWEQHPLGHQTPGHSALRVIRGEKRGKIREIKSIFVSGHFSVVEAQYIPSLQQT